MGWHSRDWRFHKLVTNEDRRTDVFMMLCNLMSWWRDDPDRLAVAVTAYEALGYGMPSFEVASARELPEGGWTENLSQDWASELVTTALRGRPKRILRARAYGLVLALIDFAPLVEETIKHRRGVEFGSIDCHQRTIEEMSVYWKARDGERNVDVALRLGADIRSKS